MPNLYEWNIIAACLHLGEAVVQTIILNSLYLSKGNAAPSIGLSIPVSAWEETNSSAWTSESTPNCEVVGPRFLPRDEGGFWNISQKHVEGPVFPIAWLVIIFFLLSGIFQGFAAWGKISNDNTGDTWYDYEGLINEGRNPIRFIEYSISASVMLAIIAVQAGIQSFDTVMLIVGANIGCQILGLVAEYFRSDLLQESRKAKQDDNQRCAPWCVRRKPGADNSYWLMVLSHAIGFVQFGFAYGTIIYHFYASIDNCSSTVPPGFVYAIVWSQFVLFASFGFVQLASIAFNEKWLDKFGVGDGEQRFSCADPESIYILLSLTAKSVLGWLLFSYVFIA